MIPLRTILNFSAFILVIVSFYWVWKHWIGKFLSDRIDGSHILVVLLFWLIVDFCSKSAWFIGGILLLSYFLSNGYALPGEAAFPITRVAVGTWAVCALGLGLFKLRQKALRAYAILEVAFGIAIAAVTMYSVGDEIELVQGLGILTSVFILVRGLDNLHKDSEERRRRAMGNPA